MTDYIKREDVEQIMYSYGIGGTMFVDDFLKPSESEEARQKEVWESVRNVLDRVAVKDVAPVRHGHWIFNQDDMTLTCSCCGDVYHFDDSDLCLDFMEYAKYCLTCGARMDGGIDDE